MSVDEFVDVRIAVGSADISADVIYRETTFQVVAAAQPGTAQIAVRDPQGIYDFTPGNVIRCWINGDLMWCGFLFTIDQGYTFEASPVRKWTLGGVDLNILFDKLILYNHAHPTWALDGGGTYQRVATEGGYQVTIPRRTPDRDYIQAMLQDTDLDQVTPTINTTRKMGEVGQINPDGFATTPSPGLTLRAFMLDVSANVQRSLPGSTIWYIDPHGYLVYQSQDSDFAPFAVGQSNVAGDAVPARGLTITTDISRIKNDVLLFTGNLNPLPDSPQSTILYRHNSLAASVSRFGRFQYSEVLGSDWLQGSINVRSTKILYQEGGPSMRADFTIFKHGLYPGQIVTIIADEHTIETFDPVLGGASSGHEINIPIRALDISFETPHVAAYRATCSYDTQDPWGLLLALKRPPTRGLVQPSFNVIDRTKAEPDPWVPAQTYMFVRERPVALGGGVYQCHYAYIRYSLAVFVSGLRVVGVPEGEGHTVGFIETDPDTGKFRIDQGGTPYVEYHVWHDLETQ